MVLVWVPFEWSGANWSSRVQLLPAVTPAAQVLLMMVTLEPLLVAETPVSVLPPMLVTVMFWVVLPPG